MIQTPKSENFTEYNDRLINCFPKILLTDVKAVLGVLPLAIHDVKLTGGKIHKVNNLIHPNFWMVQLDKEVLTIPYRLYFNEPAKEDEAKLSDTQRAILNCIYLRHHDGYLRQERLTRLQYWTGILTTRIFITIKNLQRRTLSIGTRLRVA